jgi:hypothetical protein
MTAMSLLSVIRCLLLASLVIAAACVRRADLPESATTGSARLSWSAPTANVNGTPLNAPTGFRIYYGTDPDSLSHRIEIRDPSVTAWTVGGLPPGTWYFTVTALGTNGSESEYSTITSKRIP